MSRISAFFKFEEHRTDFRTETVGGITTFVTMAYIVIVNPMILSKAMGQNLFPELLFATCISAALATFIMGIGANYPFALAPGMGLNAFFVSLRSAATERAKSSSSCATGSHTSSSLGLPS